jgi:hypothetical protein
VVAVTFVNFIVVIGLNNSALVKFDCETISALTSTLRDDLKQSEDVVDGVGSWAIRASLGDWCDWPGGWVFTVAGEPSVVIESTGESSEEPTDPLLKVRH